VCSFGSDVEELTLSLESVLYVAKQAGNKCVIGLKAGGGTVSLVSAEVYEKFLKAMAEGPSMGGMGDEEEESEEESDEEPPVPKKKAKKSCC